MARFFHWGCFGVVAWFLILLANLAKQIFGLPALRNGYDVGMLNFAAFQDD